MRRLAYAVPAFFVVLVAPTMALAAWSVSPESVRSVFDFYAMPLMFLWGLVHTRWPALRNVPNDLTPWVNVVLYIVGRFVVPDVAHAGVVGAVGGLAGGAWLVVRGALTSWLVSTLYDKFGKPVLDRYLPAAVPDKR